MRRHTLILIALMLALAIGAFACSSDATKGQDPQQMLSSAWTMHKEASSQSGDYEVSLLIESDPQASEADLGMLGVFLVEPITVSGDFALQVSPAVLDATAKTGLMGMGIQGGARVIDGALYVDMLGQWYEADAAAQQELAGADADALMEKIDQMMASLDFDPSTWCTDLKKVGDETIAGNAVVHLTGTLDMERMLKDVVELMQSPEMAEIMAMTGSAAESAEAEVGIEVPTTDEFEQILAELEQLVDRSSLEFWVSKADGSIQKMAMSVHIVPPDDNGMEALAVSGLQVVITVNLDKMNQSVDVQAPANAKPMDDLPADLEQNPLLGGLLGGLLDSGF